MRTSQKSFQQLERARGSTWSAVGLYYRSASERDEVEDHSMVMLYQLALALLYTPHTYATRRLLSRNLPRIIHTPQHVR